jgi:hypothetical protein
MLAYKKPVGLLLACFAPLPGRCHRAMANPHGELLLPVLVVANQSCYYLP